MHMIDVSDDLWKRLLSGRPCTGEGSRGGGAAALALYGPIASASGRFVLGQVGQSLDGRVATPTGDARDISGPDGIVHLHRCRALVEAVIVGIGTVKADDPLLSVRAVTGPDPVRVVIDCDGELSGRERMFGDKDAPIIVVQSDQVPRRSLGAEVIRLPQGPGGIDAGVIVEALAERGLNRLLVEGGARTLGRFIQAGLIDRLHVTVAPIILGSGPAGIVLSPIDLLASAHRPPVNVYHLGSDVIFDCCFNDPAASSWQSEKVEVADLA